MGIAHWRWRTAWTSPPVPRSSPAQGSPRLLVVGSDDDREGFREPAQQLRAALAGAHDDPSDVGLIAVPHMAHALAEEVTTNLPRRPQRPSPSTSTPSTGWQLTCPPPVTTPDGPVRGNRLWDSTDVALPFELGSALPCICGTTVWQPRLGPRMTACGFSYRDGLPGACGASSSDPYGAPGGVYAGRCTTRDRRGDIKPAPTVELFTDRDVERASLLPGWTRGHVLAHVAQGADAMRNLLVSARTEVPVAAYAGQEARDTAIETGARQRAGALLAELSASAEWFRAEATRLTERAWRQPVSVLGGAAFPAAQLLDRRLVEVELPPHGSRRGLRP
jgi:maleylpyruvate isomerase